MRSGCRHAHAARAEVTIMNAVGKYLRTNFSRDTRQLGTSIVVSVDHCELRHLR
jgi:hypothetical protein